MPTPTRPQPQLWNRFGVRTSDADIRFRVNSASTPKGTVDQTTRFAERAVF